ncbi:MAG: hypothetical protein WBD62_11295 [Anaerolineales bacterium]
MLSIRSLTILAIPVGLVVASGVLFRKRGNPETAGRRFFLFLTWMSIGLLAVGLIINGLSHSGYGVITILAPVASGVIALTFIHLREWHTLHSREKTLIFLSLILLTILAVLQIWVGSVRGISNQPESIFFGLAIFSISVFLPIAWTIGKRYPALLGVAALLFMALFNGSELGVLPLPAESLPIWLTVLSVAAYVMLPGFVIAAMAALTSNSLKLLPPSGESDSPSWRPVIGRMALVVILLGYLLYTFAWLWIWDGTDDGLRSLTTLIVSGMAATAAGMVIGLTLTGWRAWIGLAFAILTVGSIFLVALGLEGRFHPYTITETRAFRIEEAVEGYRETTGSYPAELDALIPGELWRIPRPMIFQDQGWCYEGGSDYYRLGAIYRDHWSSPILSVRLYASAGNPPETSWVCDEKLAKLRSQFDIVFNTPPTPLPLPTSAVSIQRTTVEPVLQATSISVGSWSSDGVYLVFGLAKYYGELGDQVEIDLHFLNAETGEICQAVKSKWTAGFGSDGLREHHAWLPDGKLLYVSESGEMAAFKPCADGVEELASRYPVTFSHALSYDPQSGRVLLKNHDSYWLLDGASLETHQVLGITPNPSEVHWGWYAWSPGGERLAISLMSGPEADDEANLYIVDGASGEVERSLPLEGASDAGLPMVEWLTRDELLIQGNTLNVLDLHADPLKITNLIRDIFLLDIVYPDDFSSMDYLPNPDGDEYYLGVRVNHPRNQAVYLNSSETNQVEVFQHDTYTLSFFPGGQWMVLPKWEDTPTYRDEYELVWMDQPGETQRLVVGGHMPRSHPQMFPKYLPSRSQLIFSSSQGISLVSIPDGEMVGFWELAGGGYSSYVIPTPHGESLVVVAGGVGLYYISLSLIQ